MAAMEDKAARRFSVKIRRRVEVAIIIIGVFYAGFAAFNEEHKKREGAEKALRKTPRTVNVAGITDTEGRKELDKTKAQLVLTRDELTKTLKDVKQLEIDLKKANETIARQSPINRTLTHSQHKKLVEALKDIGIHRIAIRRDPQTPETQAYSDQFESVFTEAGWTIVEPKFLIHKRAQKGVRILFDDRKNQMANKLYEAMILAGVAVTGGSEEPALDKDSIELLIGFPEDSMPPSPTPDKEASPH